MKIVYFKNESGDSAYPICRVDCDFTQEQLKQIVNENVGDDYYDGELCGEFWIEELLNVPTLSKLMKKSKLN